MATMSLRGLYTWDNTILDPLINDLPSIVNATAFKAELLAECSELEILYTNPAYLKTAIFAWATGRKDVWQRMADALTAKYNITENYDRTEEWTDTGSSSGDSSDSHKTRGYPSTGGMIEQDLNSSNGKSSSTAKHTGRVHGNIGVRSAQELVEQELALAEKADLEEYIIRDFKNRFCLLVY